MKHLYSITLVIATLACTPVSASPFSSAAGRYRIDPASHIGFSIAQVAGPGINGTIPDISGRFDIDPDQPSKSYVEISLNPSSVKTGQERVENFLRSSAVFNIAAYPQIVFRSNRVTQDGRAARSLKACSRPEASPEPRRFTQHSLSSKRVPSPSMSPEISPACPMAWVLACRSIRTRLPST